MKIKNIVLSSALSVSIFSGIQTAEAVNVFDDEEKGTRLSILGRLEAGFLNQFARESDKAALESNARLGVLGTTSIGNDFKAIGFAEWEVASTSSQNGKFDTRYAYVGFDLQQYGTLVFGQGDTAEYLTVGMTDVFELWGSQANTYWQLGGRQEGQIMYSLAVGDYSAAVSYQTAALSQDFEYYSFEFDKNVNLKVSNGAAFAFSYNWSKGALKDAAISAAYSYYTFSESSIGDKHTVDLALSYGLLNKGLYTAFLFNSSKYAAEHHHTYGFEGVAGYGFENGISFMLGGGYLGFNLKDTRESYAMAQLTYNFTDNFKAYAEGKFGLGRLDYPVKDKTHQHQLFGINVQYNY